MSRQSDHVNYERGKKRTANGDKKRAHLVLTLVTKFEERADMKRREEVWKRREEEERWEVEKKNKTLDLSCVH